MKMKNLLIVFALALFMVLTSCTNNVEEYTLESIEVSENSQLTFKPSEFELSKIYINCIYSNGDRKEISLTNDMLSEELPDSLGKHTLQVNYEGKSCEIEIELLGVVSLEFGEESPRVFKQNHFDCTLIDMYQLYSNGMKEYIVVQPDMISDIDKTNNVGTYELHITYNGITVLYEVEIIENDDVDNFEFEALPYNEGYIVTGYNGDRTNLIIPSEYNGLPVKEIAEEAFFKNTTIVRVVIPNTVTTIGKAAFYQSTSIQSIIIPNSVTTIGDYACRGIKTIYLESEVVPSGYSATWYDEQNSYINFGMKIDEIEFNGEYEYYYKDGGVVLSNYFGSDYIVYVPSIINDKLPIAIGGACFKDNLNIEELYIPESVTKLEKYALAGLESLTTLRLSSNIEEIGDYALRGCILIETIELPTNLKKIGHSAFNMCSSLTSIILPDKVEYVGEYAFSWCVKVTKIYIPLSVKVMKAGACYSCSKATIYTAYESAPETWETGWNQSSRPVKWGQDK